MSLSLIPHPDHPPHDIRSVEASVLSLGPHWLCVRWKVEGARRLVIPPFAGKGRADGLWGATCFELFLKSAKGAGGAEPGAYCELNFSPSERWAAYDFSGYRSGMAERPMQRQPDCTIRRGGNVIIFDASVPLSALPPLPWRTGICAVLEEEGGRKSYWALAHGKGQADFHDPACFAVSLAPRDSA